MIWLLGCTSDAPQVDPELGNQLLEARRVTLVTVEREVLWNSAVTALDAGSPADAARAAVLGWELDPERFGPLLERVGEAEDPRALQILADRVDWRRFGARAADAAAKERWATGQGPAWSAGVDRRRGLRVLSGALAEYVVEPDRAAMVAAVRRRLAVVGAPADLAGDDVPSLLDDAVAKGLPEAVAWAEGVHAALGALDRYTAPVWGAELASWQDHHEGAADGIGASVVDGPDGGVLVELPVVDGPAWRAGVHAGDAVAAIDGAAVTDARDAAARLLGEPGVPVVLTLSRGGEPLELSVVRAHVEEETVRGWSRGPDGWVTEASPGIAVVRVTAFRPHTDEALDALLPEAPEVVVLDLRGNGGGDVMAAVNLADRFVADGILAQLGGRTIEAPQAGAQGELPWNAAVEGHALEGVPVVVLVDGGTASSAELVAGALRERAGAVLVGERTYGKGLAQALRVDEALGVGWQVTNGTWMLPSSATLEADGVRRGLLPDHVVPTSPAERLQNQVLRRRRELPPVHPDGTPVPDLGTRARDDLPILGVDRALAVALDVARTLTVAR